MIFQCSFVSNHFPFLNFKLSINTTQTGTSLATAFWKFREKILHDDVILHHDHVIKIQCRITPSCRIGFAVGVWFGCFASLPLQELQQRNISYFNKQKQKILMFCFALIFNVCGNWSTAAKFFTMRVQSELAFKVLDLNTAFTKMEGVRSAVSESCWPEFTYL